MPDNPKEEEYVPEIEEDLTRSSDIFPLTNILPNVNMRLYRQPENYTIDFFFSKTNLGAMMQCPYCKEEIKDGAIKCKHCKSLLNENTRADSETATASATQTKQCPFCAEDIQITAVKCKHCGESLANEIPIVADAIPEINASKEFETETPDKQRKPVLAKLSAIVGAVIYLIFAYVQFTSPSGGAWAGIIMIGGAIVFFLLAPIGWALGDMFRRFVHPDMYFASGAMGLLKARLFWLVGPQLVGVLVAFIIVAFASFGTLQSVSNPDSKTAEASVEKQETQLAAKPVESATATSNVAPSSVPEQSRQSDAPKKQFNIEDAQILVGKYLDAHSKRYLPGLVNYYAEQVDYSTRGNVNRDFIRKDKERFFRAYDNIALVIEGEPTVTDISEIVKLVEFAYSYNISNSNKSLTGKAMNRWQLQLINNEWLIVDEKQNVIKSDS